MPAYQHGSLGAANEQLGSVQGLLSTTQSGLNDISNTMASMRAVLIKLSDNDVAGNQRQQYKDQYKSLLANMKTFSKNSNYNNKTLIGNFAGAVPMAANVNVVRNETGASYSVALFNGSGVYNALSGMGNGATATIVAASLAGFDTQGVFGG